MGIISSIINAGMQHATNKHNEALMREAWEREDTAVQRRVEDLKAAGMNPILAAGEGAPTSTPLKADAPQVDSDFGLGSIISAVSGVSAIANSIQDYRAQELAMRQSKGRYNMDMLSGMMGLSTAAANLKQMQWRYDEHNPAVLDSLRAQTKESESRKTLNDLSAGQRAMDLSFRQVYKDTFGVYPPEHIPNEMMIPLMLQQIITKQLEDAELPDIDLGQKIQETLNNAFDAIDKTMRTKDNGKYNPYAVPRRHKSQSDEWHGGDGRGY